MREQAKWSTAKKGRNSFSKRRKEFTPGDHANEHNICTKVKELFANNHYPPEGWHLYSENSNTACGHVMSGVSLSRGQDKKKYWDHFAGSITEQVLD